MEEWAKPWPWQTADLAEPLCQRACMWHHVTPRGCVGSRAELSVIVYPEPGHPRARVPIILPCHGYCSAGLDALRQAFSHCEVVWEKHSSLDPGENNIRTSQTRACVLVQTVVTGLAAVSLLRHARLAEIISQFKGANGDECLNKKKQSVHKLSSIFMFLLLLVFCFYLSYSGRFGMRCQ